MYAVNWTELLEDNYPEYIVPNSSWPTQSCQHGWEYSRDEIQSSIVIDVSDEIMSSFFFKE